MARYRLGRQVLGELALCDRIKIDDERTLDLLLRQAAQAAGAHLISVHVHRFQPHGLSEMHPSAPHMAGPLEQRPQAPSPAPAGQFFSNP